MLNLINAVFGGVLLVAGRKLFWFLVGAVGFGIGILVATRFFHGSELVTILAGLLLGVIFALLAIFLESVAIALAGFLGGGYVLLNIAALLGFDKGALAWIAFIAGGIIGVALVAFLFDWALISISSLAGASMIVNAFQFRPATSGLIFFLLLIAGVVIQGTVLRREKGAQAQSA